MYTPQKLIVKNIGPIEKIEYDFKNKIVLLTGENLTDEGQDSNGSGKSYILESIAYATTGTSFRKITDGELVREGEKEAYILLSLYNPVSETLLAIERHIYSGNKSSKLIIAINGHEQTSITSVNEGNKYILDELGLSREDILNYFMISKEKYTSFFSSSDTAKKELIGRFSKANLIDDLIPKVEVDKKVVTDEIVSIEKIILSLESKIEVLKEQEDPEEIEKLKIENENKIKNLIEQIENLENKNNDLQNQEVDLQNAVLDSEKALKLLKPTEEIKKQIKENEISLESLNSDIRQLEKERKESQNILNEIERNLAGVVECPKCSHRFNVSDPEFDVAEGETMKSELEELVSGLKSEIKEFELKTPEIRNVIQKLNDEINKTRRVENELQLAKSKAENQIAMNRRTIKHNEGSIAEFIEKVEKLSNLEFEPEENTDKIKYLQKQIKDNNKKLEQLSEKERGFDLWILNLKSFKTYLANKSLANITNQTNLYLEKLGSSIRVKFEGFKELKSGKTREQISVRIFKFGEDRGSFGKLSGGEKARVEVALILSLSSLINLSSESGGLNLVVIDEILESLDSTGLKSILKAMNNIDQHVILVTHGKLETQEGYSELRIVKENGKSYLKNL